jgi:DNA-binding NarL/FixJ family response regulator
VEPTARILVIDPHGATRAPLVAALAALYADRGVEGAPDMDVALARIAADGVPVVVLDEALASLDTAAGRAALSQLSERTAVVVMGMGDRDQYERPYAASGARGYWPKYGDIDLLADLLCGAFAAAPSAG